MAIATMIEFEPTEDRGTPNYDAIQAKMGMAESPPEGLIVHTAGFDDAGRFRIFNVWETAEHVERFESEHLMPAIREVLGEDVTPPAEAVKYELHNVVTGRS